MITKCFHWLVYKFSDCDWLIENNTVSQIAIAICLYCVSTSQSYSPLKALSDVSLYYRDHNILFDMSKNQKWPKLEEGTDLAM